MGPCAADTWFYATQSYSRVSPALWESWNCTQKTLIMLNPIIGAQIVELEKVIERAGLTEHWRDAIARLPKPPSIRLRF